MTYCANCGMIIESYDCPMCGVKNFKPLKPGEKSNPVPTPTPTPAPTPAPSPGPGAPDTKRPVYMVTGFIGSLIIAISALFLGIIPLYNMMNGGLGSFESSLIYFLIIFSSILFLTGSTVLFFGFYGLYKRYGSNLSLAVMILTLVSPLILVIFTTLSLESTSYSYNRIYSYYYVGPELWLGHLYVGFMFILMGLSLRHIGNRMGLNYSNVIVGSVFILGGVMFILFAGIFGFAWILISVASIVMATHFLVAKPYVPNSYSGIEPTQQ